MSQQLISRSADLKRLRDEGYNVEVKQGLGYVLIHGVPYVNTEKQVRTGTLVTALTLAGDKTTTPADHTVMFAGEQPCDQHGTPLTKIMAGSSHSVLAEGVEIDHTFSSKPVGGQPYPNYYEKLTAYINILLGPAQAIDPAATAQTFDVIPDDTEESVFRYLDSATSRAQIGAVTEKLKIPKVAIVGLGGTGAYVLDLIAKTPIQEIHLFDGDEFLQHNAFRSPGAPTLETLEAKPMKVDHFAAQYDPMRTGIVPHAEYLTAANVNLLDEMNFVFLCLDAGEGKHLIVDHLETTPIPFVDAGMGLYEAGGSIGGIVRVTTSTPADRRTPHDKLPLDAAVDDIYEQNIQIADLNALAASLAVIKWKKLYGFYLDFDAEFNALYTVDGNHLLNETLDDED